MQQQLSLLERFEQIIATRPPIPTLEWRELYLAYRRLIQVARIRATPINGLGLSAEELTGHHLIAAATSP